MTEHPGRRGWPTPPPPDPRWQRASIPDLQGTLDAFLDTLPRGLAAVAVVDTGPAVAVALTWDGDLPPVIVAAIGKALEQAGRRIHERAAEAAERS